MICLVRLIVAAVCGLLIGVERQTRMKGAGSRTHMMVSLGAALMTLVSSYGFLLIVGAAGVSVDVSRVAASIAVGLTDGKATLCACMTGWHRGKSPCERSTSSGRKAVR